MAKQENKIEQDVVSGSTPVDDAAPVAGPEKVSAGEAKADRPEPPKSNPPEPKGGKLLVENKNRAGMTVFAVTGKPIVFNSDGVASIDQADYDYLKTVPGYETK